MKCKYVSLTHTPFPKFWDAYKVVPHLRDRTSESLDFMSFLANSLPSQCLTYIQKSKKSEQDFKDQFKALDTPSPSLYLD